MSKVGLIAGLIAVIVVGVIGYEISNMNKQPTAPMVKTLEPITAQRDLKLEEWHHFVSPQQDFEVLIPTFPQHATNSASDSHHLKEAFVSEADIGTLFMINKITLEESSDNINTLLAHTVDDFIKSIPSNKILKKQSGKFQNNPSMIFSLENPDVVINGIAFIQGSTLYMLSSTAKKDMFSQYEFDYFLNSFRLSPKTALPNVSPPVNVPAANPASVSHSALTK